MRKKVKVALVLVFMAVFGFLGYQFYTAFQEKEATAQKIQDLPEFSLVELAGNRMTQNDIMKDHWTVFVFFNSECHFCQEEAQQLSETKEYIENIDFIWVSSESKKAISDFKSRYQLTDRQNCIFLLDKGALFSTDLKIDTTPQFLIYSPKQKLIKNHKGAWRIDKLLKHIAENTKTP